MQRIIAQAIFTVLIIVGSVAAQPTDKRVEDIRRVYEQTNSDIATAEREAPYSEIYVVEMSINKTANAYPSGGMYSNVTKFYYTFADRENDPTPRRLLKINVVTKRSALITSSEFLFNPAGQLIFGLVRIDGERQRETQLYFANGQLIALIDGGREVNVRLKAVIDTAAAFKRESARLTAMFAVALKEGL